MISYLLIDLAKKSLKNHLEINSLLYESTFAGYRFLLV